MRKHKRTHIAALFTIKSASEPNADRYSQRRTKNIQPRLTRHELSGRLLRISWVAQVQFQPQHLSIPWPQTFMFKLSNGPCRTRLIPSCKVDLRSCSRKMADSSQSNASAIFRMRQLWYISGFQQWTHFPPVTIATFPFKSTRSVAGSNFREKRFPIL